MSRKPILKVAERLSHPHPDSLLTFMVVLTKRTFTLTVRRKFVYWTLGLTLSILTITSIGSGWGLYATKKILTYSNLEKETKDQQELLKASTAFADKLAVEVEDLNAIVNDLMKEIGPSKGGASPSAANPSGGKKGEVTAEQLDKISTLKNELGKTDEQLKSLQAQMEPLIYTRNHTPSVWPTVGSITSRFGRRVDPFSRSTGGDDPFFAHHSGIDISNGIGTPIQATANGEVTYIGWLGNYGQTVTIRHTPDLETVYGHLHRVYVRLGQKVVRGQQVGTMGETGRATGPHLHYEIRKKGQAVNPEPYLKLQRQWLTGIKQ
ncbi:MAG: peptidoglycan DD-metalloendopeptidase family protein [Holophagales bacterium]|jgi:murein DD-endopeptidase MepM/ murein hydrolase activator NlpD|nr:peptidoglycan DD-metalloendopeptidase family protein [Holophagales bacterium]